MTGVLALIADFFDAHQPGIAAMLLVGVPLGAAFASRARPGVNKTQLFGRVVQAFVGSAGIVFALSFLPMMLRDPGAVSNCAALSANTRAGFLALPILLALVGAYYALVEAFGPHNASAVLFPPPPTSTQPAPQARVDPGA